MASPSAGPWLETAPDSVDQLLLQANDKLSAQDIATIDRYFGEHSDCRLRLTLGTIEVCNYDTFAGHPKKIAAFQTLTTAILTNLQLMKLYGQDPAREFPELFGHAHGQAALDAANRHNFAVARDGMDAVVNGRRVSDYCESLIALATRHQLFPLDATMQDEIRRSYTSNADTRAELRRWCARNNCLPSMAAYYETGIGTPSVYLLARAEALREQSPDLPIAEVIRHCELDMAQTYVGELENAA